MTTHLVSKVKSIDDLVFAPLLARPVKVLKAVCVNGTFVALGPYGTIYVSGLRNRIAYRNCTPKSLKNALEGCIKLGVLSKEAVDQHRKIQDEYHKKADQKYTAEQILANAADLGIKLTKAQDKMVRKYIGK